MKSAILFFLLAAAFGSLAQPQTSTASSSGAHDPTYINQVYFWAPDSLMSLEKASGEMKPKMKAMGFGGGGMAYILDGARSATRIKAADNLRFAIKLSGMMDPTMVIKLYQLDPKKKSREATVSSQGGMFNKSAAKTKNGIDCNVQKSGTDVYILIPATRLTPGEYGFMNMMQATGGGAQVAYTFFTFGIDQ